MNKIKAIAIIAAGCYARLPYGGIRAARNHLRWLKAWANNSNSFGPKLPAHWAHAQWLAAVALWGRS